MALASSSHASSYDVFLSFRGDTRHSFTGHLYKALCDKEIYTFIDDEELRSGEIITEKLMKAIEDSRVAIIVLSKDYASSSFCLDELTTIIDCSESKGVLVIPVFYKIDPSDVRHVKGSYGEALAKYEETFQHNEEKLKKLPKWKNALNQVSNLSGQHIKEGVYEYKIIEKIVDRVLDKINHFARLSVPDHLVGLEPRKAEVMKLLDVGSHDGVHMVGIHGMGGVGKSTLARVVYNDYLIAEKFDGSCYLEKVRENKHEHLQSVLLQKILRDKDINVTSVEEGASMIRTRLLGKKVLLLLDDVDKYEQLKEIVGRPHWFGPGSRVIITTRDKDLLRSYDVERTYVVRELHENYALELLTRNAFKGNKADPSYEEVLNRVVTYASGLPLALEVIGSHLYGKRIDEWESTIDKYKRSPHKRINDILKLSFDALDEEERSVFLDIACYFNGYELWKVKDILSAHYGYRVEHHIDKLVKKSLIKYTKKEIVTLHDLIEDMGKEIVQQESPKEPGMRSRLWLPKDIREVLEEDTGTPNIEMIICVDFSILDGKIEWEGNAFEKMTNLKTLIIRSGIFSQGPKILPKSLKVLNWWGYPSNSLRFKFHTRELAKCELPKSGLMSLEFGGSSKKFTNLTVLNFDECEQLTRICDISSCPNLEELSFKWCRNLETVHESNDSLVLHKLKVLSAEGCSKLKSFPPIKLTSLTILKLSYCSSLESFPRISGKMENIKKLYLVNTAIKELPMSFQYFIGLENLYLKGLPSSFVVMPQLPESEAIDFKGGQWVEQENDEEKVGSKVFSKLKCISAAGCNLKDDFFSIGFTRFKHVTYYLELSGNNFTVLPECFKEFQSLSRLVVNDCKHLQEIKGVPPNIDFFIAKNCTSLTSSGTSMLINKDLYWAGACVLPKACVREVFDHQSRGPSNSFWFRNKFPAKVLCLLINPKGIKCERDCSAPLVVINGKVHEPFSHEYKIRERMDMPGAHASIFNLDLRNYDQFGVPLENEWNHVEVTYAGGIDTSTFGGTGIHLFKQESNNEDIQFTNPYALRRSRYSSLRRCKRDSAMPNMFHYGLNYADWSKMIKFQLSVEDLDLALVMDESPPVITETSTDTDKSLYEAWEQSNRSALDLMRSTMAANVKSVMPKTDNAKEFMKLVKDYSQSRSQRDVSNVQCYYCRENGHVEAMRRQREELRDMINKLERKLHVQARCRQREEESRDMINKLKRKLLVSMVETMV